MNTPDSLTPDQEKVLKAMNQYHAATPLQLEIFASLYDIADVGEELKKLRTMGLTDIHKEGRTSEPIYWITQTGRDRVRSIVSQ